MILPRAVCYASVDISHGAISNIGVIGQHLLQVKICLSGHMIRQAGRHDLRKMSSWMVFQGFFFFGTLRPPLTLPLVLEAEITFYLHLADQSGSLHLSITSLLCHKVLHVGVVFV